MANCPSTVRGPNRGNGLRPVKRGECNRDSAPLFMPGLYRRSVLCPAEARSGPHVVRAGYEVVGAVKDLGPPAIVVAIMRHAACGVEAGVPLFTAMTDRRHVSTASVAVRPHPGTRCSRSGPACRAILPVLWRDPYTPAAPEVGCVGYQKRQIFSTRGDNLHAVGHDIEFGSG